MKNNYKTRIFSIVLVLMMMLGALGMPTSRVQAAGVTLDGAVSSSTADDVSSISFAHTTGTGTDRLILVGVSWNCGTTNRTITSVTFTPDAGSPVGLTEVITQLGYNASNPRYSAIYRLLNPPSGQAGTVTINFSGSVSNGIMAGAANFAGVNQTTPLGVPNGANGTSSTAPSVDFTGLNGDELVFDNVFLGAGSSSYTLSVGSDQTELWNPAYVTNLRAAASIEQATSSSVTMSWTASTQNYWAITAVPINPAPAGPTHDLTIATAGNGSGTVDPTVGDHTYPEDEVVPLVATANAGSTFDGWSGDADCEDGSVTMDADKACTATFTAIEYTLSITSDHGTVTKNPDQPTYHFGDVVQLTAEPASGYLFTAWTGDLTSSDNPDSINIDGNKSVTANYFDTTGLAIVDGAPGSGTADPTNSSISFEFTTGTGPNRLMLVGVSWNCGTSDQTIDSVAFTPDLGSPLDLDEVFTQQYNWSSNYRYTAIYSLLGPPSGVSGTVDITFSGAVSNGIIAGAASFANVNQTDPLGTPGGDVGTGNNTSGTPNPSVTLTELAGNELVFDSVFIGVSNVNHAITADSGQSELWNISGYPTTSFNTLGAASTRYAIGTSATMSWTTANYGSTATRWAIAAVPINPAPTQYTLTAGSSGHGSVTLDPTGGTYLAGTNVTLTPIPDTGYHFVSWTGPDAGDIIDTGGIYTIVMDDDKSITANFAIDTHTLTASNDGNGSVTLDPTGGTYDYGTIVTLTPVPNADYHFVSWTGPDAGDIVNTGGVYTIVMDGDKSITANFAIDMYILTASNDGHGSVTLDPTGGTYAAGTTVTLTPVPDTGYHFVSWTGSDAGDIIDTGGVYTIVMDGDKSITANFAIDIYYIYLPIVTR